MQETTAVDYLKTLAVSRLYLDNIDHIQSSWLTRNPVIARPVLDLNWPVT